MRVLGKRTRQFTVALLALTSILCSHVFGAQEGKGEVASQLAAVQAAKPDESRAVHVRNIEIDMGPGTLVIDQGVLLPAQPVSGKVLEIAFSGEATFRFSASDPVEQHQLELFTGERSLNTDITQAILVTADETIFANLMKGERASGNEVREVTRLFEEWTRGAERQGFAADLTMARALAGDPSTDGYFAVFCKSPEQGDFFYVLDPSQDEDVHLGQFVPLDMSSLDVWQQRYVKNYVRLYGAARFADFSVENPGQWDTWSSFDHGAGEVPPPVAEHYVLDIYVNPAIELDAKCSARIRLRAESAGTTTISFSLFAGLRVTGVLDHQDTPLDYLRREGALHVFLPERFAPGETIELRVDYEGDLVEQVIKNEWYRLKSTETWYPWVGTANRATFDVTVRRPKKFDVMASGRMVEDGEEGHARWQRNVLDVPAFGFTFELGRFDIVTDQSGHVEFTFAFPVGEYTPTEEERTRIIETSRKALPFFEERFGPYPLDYMTVVIVPRFFSQGFLSMVTLANPAIKSPKEDWPLRYREGVEEQAVMTIAHEISHQWWGNWVGWASYRDQWLSEAVASYCALLYGMSSAESKAAFLARNALDWRSALDTSTSEGRTLASLGPVTLGVRLDSSKSGTRSNSYQAIVYEKGAVVFRMLAQLYGEETFTKILSEISKAVGNGTIDTATFIKAIEKMSGADLGPFAAQFIYGTGIPEVYYGYSIDEASDAKGWVIRGKARQVPSRVESFSIDRQDGRWLMQRKVRIDLDVPTSTLIVPFQVIITPPDEVKKGKKGTIQKARGFGGRVVLKGGETSFEYTVPEKPERFELDQLGEVLAYFRDEEWLPKLTLRMQGEDLEATGDFNGAEELLRKALLAPIRSERAIAWLSSDEELTSKDREKKEEYWKTQETFENARIHTLLARFLVDRGEYDAAEKELATAEESLEKPKEQAGWVARLKLHSRIDLARGDPKSAYLRLKTGRYRWWLGADGYALLAVAASETGHTRLARRALETAESRGVDMRALRQSMETTTASGL